MPEEDFALPPASAVQDQPVSAPTAPTPAAKKSQSAVLILVAVAVALVALLLGLTFTQHQEESSVSAAVDPSVALLQAELDNQRAVLNARRAELGIPPLAETSKGGEPTQEIASRLAQDSASLATVLDSLQKIIAEKDKTIEQINAALLASEQARKALTESANRAQASTATTANQSHVAEMMQRKIELLEKELADTKAALANASKAAPDEETQRRLDEAQRAREFFEKRVKELEQQSPQGEKEEALPPPPADQ